MGSKAERQEKTSKTVKNGQTKKVSLERPFKNINLCSPDALWPSIIVAELK